MIWSSDGRADNGVFDGTADLEAVTKVKEKLQKAFVFSLKFVPFVMIFSCL
jgi:hypothetical protein